MKQTSPSGWTACCNRSPLYLSVCRRNVPASIDPQQCVVWQREVELDVGWMVHGHMKPPEKSWWDGLALLGAHVDLAAVDGSASHPLFCRWKPTDRRWWEVFLPIYQSGQCSRRFQREQLISNLVSSNIGVICDCINEWRLNRHQENHLVLVKILLRQKPLHKNGPKYERMCTSIQYSL